LLQAEGALRRESGNYDPQLFFNVNHLDNHLPQSSYLAGAQDLATQQTTSQGGVRLNLPIGTRLEARMTTSRLETNSALASLNPEYSTAGILSLRQPLLGGFAASGRKLLSKAETDLAAQKDRYDEQVIATKSDVGTGVLGSLCRRARLCGAEAYCQTAPVNS